MLYIIVYDLETTYSYKKGQVPEIVEIGAVKVDADNRQIIDQFQCYVFPKIRGRFDNRTRNFIGMKEEDERDALSFPQAADRLTEWLGDEYYFCAWGPDDKRYLVEHCVRYGVPLTWLRNTNNIQTPISQLLGPQKQMGLSKALELTQLAKEGRFHSAIDDAVNTARLLIHYLDQITLETNSYPAFEGESCSLFRTCRGCKKEKSYRQFRARKTYCKRCEAKWRAKRFASPSPE